MSSRPTSTHSHLISSSLPFDLFPSFLPAHLMFLFNSFLSLFTLCLAAQAATIPSHVRTHTESSSSSESSPEKHTTGMTGMSMTGGTSMTGMTMTTHTKTHNLPAAAKPTHTGSKPPSSPPAYYSHYSRSSCTPFKSTFGSGSVGSKGSSSSSEPFVAVSPEGSWALGEGGLELYMEKPKGDVKTEGGINDVVADGATVNSTFTML